MTIAITVVVWFGVAFEISEEEGGLDNPLAQFKNSV